VDWTQRSEDGIKYYSGKAVYRKTFDTPWLTTPSACKLYLDLGTVHDLAEVRLNGKTLGVVWTAPWRIEITDTIKPVGNELEIGVVNLWPNRLIGDGPLPPEQRRTKTNRGTYYQGKHSLLPSGLLGKERIITIHDGSFGWSGERCLVQVHHFDRDGKRTGKGFTTAITREAKTKVEIPYGEAVVLERLPVTLTPEASQATVKEACYDGSGLSLSVRAPSRASLRIASGKFPIVPQQRLNAQIGDTRQLLTAWVDATVELPLPPTTAFVAVRLTKPKE
jgi:hypothetical protein